MKTNPSAKRQTLKTMIGGAADLAADLQIRIDTLRTERAPDLALALSLLTITLAALGAAILLENN